MSDARETAEAIARATSLLHELAGRRRVDSGRYAIEERYQEAISIVLGALAFQDAVIAEQAESIDLYAWRVAEAYQVVSALAGIAGVFYEPSSQRAMDLLHAPPYGDLGKESMLPFAVERIPLDDMCRRAEAAEARIAYLEAKLAERTRERDESDALAAQWHEAVATFAIERHRNKDASR
jgi:hypothetical protein